LPVQIQYAVNGDVFTINGLIARNGEVIDAMPMNDIHDVDALGLKSLENSIKIIGHGNNIKLGSRTNKGDENKALKWKRGNKTYAQFAEKTGFVTVTPQEPKGYVLTLNDKGKEYLYEVIKPNLDILKWQVQAPESKPKSRVSNVGLECPVCSEVMFVRLAQAKRISDGTLKAWKHCNKPVVIQEQYHDIVLT